MKYKKILVTGSSGFLGSHVVDILNQKDCEVVLFDAKPSPFKKPNQKEIIGDILNLSDITKALDGCDAVFHFAAQADIDTSTSDPSQTILQNIIGTDNLLSLSVKMNVKRFVFSSTIYVYSNLGSFYKASKQSCEKIIEEYNNQYNLDYTILRFGSLYGPRANEFNAIRSFIEEALKNGKITRNGSGEELREYIHVVDAAKLSVESLKRTYKNKHLILTGNHQVKIKDLLKMISEMLDNKIKIEYTEENQSHHYEITPYNYRPEIAKRLTAKSHHDLGQGLLDQIYEIDKELKKG